MPAFSGPENVSAAWPPLAPQATPNGQQPRAVRIRKTLGVLEGEGIGPEVVSAALRVLAALEPTCAVHFEIRRGGPIGLEAVARGGQALSEEVAAFCGQVFAEGGAVLSGPGGGRFVYELRRRFDLYCKLSPLKPAAALRRAGRLRARHLRGVDILIVRDNSGGIYQGRWQEWAPSSDGWVAEHSFSYTERQVRRILEAGARAALARRGAMSVVVKEEGIPSVSRLWREVAGDVAGRHGVACTLINIDHAAYRLVQHPREFDVIVTPNLFGDILADIGGVLLGSRGLSFSGNFSPGGEAVYQTNHGAAFDLAGSDRANPVGQILSLAMLLDTSFGLRREAALVTQAVEEVCRQGWRTDDLAQRGCRPAGTNQLADLVARAVARLAAGGGAS